MIAWRGVLSVILTVAVPTASAADQVSDRSRPNVLMISVDDLNDWTGYLGGHPNAQTPHLDALAARGRVFANAHCAVPVCSPSRVCVMSGLAATTTGSYEIGPSYESIARLDSVPCLQQYFRDHGYTTLAGGKVLHHGFNGPLASAIETTLIKRRNSPRPKPAMNQAGLSPAWQWGPFPETDDEMFDFRLAKAAADALQAEYDRPFMMSVGLYRPHVPMYVPPKWFDKFPLDEIELPDAAGEDLDDVPPNFLHIRQVAPTHAQVTKADQWRGLVQAYLASTAFVDHCVGVMLDSLAAGPHADNTVVVLWSDHGFHLGEKQHWAKRTLWEESTRVPFLIAGPGIEPGSHCAEPVSLLDVYPTLVDLCGLPANATNEGLSLRPQLDNPAAERDRPAIISSFYGNHAVRSRDWRYIRYADGAEELYDHRVDQPEYRNLAGDSEYRDVKNAHARWLPTTAAPEVLDATGKSSRPAKVARKKREAGTAAPRP